MRKTLSLVVLWATIAGLMATSSASTIGVVLPGSLLFFYRAMTKGIEHAAKDLHVELLIRSPSDGTSLDTHSNIQLRIVDYMVKSGVAGILLVPEPLVDAATPVLVAVPTVLIDRSNADYNAISAVRTDNFTAGKTAARCLLPVLPKRAKIAILRLAPEINSTTERENGFLSVAREAGWDVVIDTYVGYRPRDAEELVAKALNGYVGHLDAVFAPAEPIAYGALRVIEARPASDRPRLVVFDWRPEFMDAIIRGVIFADVVQDPYQMGYLAVETLVTALQGRSPKSQIFVDVVVITRANLNDRDVRAVLANYDN